MKHSQPDSAQTYLQYKQEIKSTKSTCPAVNPLHIRTSSCSVCYHTHLSENEKAAPHRSVSHLVWQSSFKLVLWHLLVSMNQNIVLGIYRPWGSSALQTSWYIMTNVSRNKDSTSNSFCTTTYSGGRPRSPSTTSLNLLVVRDQYSSSTY